MPVVMKERPLTPQHPDLPFQVMITTYELAIKDEFLRKFDWHYLIVVRIHFLFITE
jgi:SNF2 family DNA or RNA helicase